jgi:hypothetical protein
MPGHTLQSPLLHHSIYLEEAVHHVLQTYYETRSIPFEVTTERHGWRIRFIDDSDMIRDYKTLLKEMMNEILVQSLEARLEDMVS